MTIYITADCKHPDDCEYPRCHCSVDADVAPPLLTFTSGGSSAWQSVWQEWVLRLPLMQQATLASAIRGPDGFKKYHPVKPIIRWLRRSCMLSAYNRNAILNPVDRGGASFAGPSCEMQRMVDGSSMVTYPTWQIAMGPVVDDFMQTMDEFNLHSWLHLLHAVEIIGYGHDNAEVGIWWRSLYARMVAAMHLKPETAADLYARQSDNFEKWSAHSDPGIERDPSKRKHAP